MQMDVFEKNLRMGNVKFFINIKWIILISVLVINSWEYMSSALNISGFIAVTAGIFLSSLVNIYMQSCVTKDKIPAHHFFLVTDFCLIFAILYINGGVQNTWFFFPALLIFLVGYIFSTRVSFIYALLCSICVSAIFLLEYYYLIPRHHIFAGLDGVWENLAYINDYISGMVLLYFLSAFISSRFSYDYFSAAEKLRKNLEESHATQENLETSRKALLNLMEDLNTSRHGLEQRVRERTSELQASKLDLEEKIEERTEDLEKSRNAVLHMMKNLRDDMDKLKTIDQMKTRFLSLISHELKTPLTPIYEYTALLKENAFGELNPKQIEAINSIQRQSIHLKNLIDNVLDITRIEMGKKFGVRKEPLLLSSILADVEEAVKFDMDKMGLTLQKELEPDLPTLFADGAAIRRTLMNLIGNAIKFTPRGGRIKIIIKHEAENILINIADTGIGIAPENLHKIFEEFYQIDNPYTRHTGGLGMGLSIVKGIVESHGGAIQVESKGPGFGTTFLITLPLFEQEKEGGEK